MFINIYKINGGMTGAKLSHVAMSALTGDTLHLYNICLKIKTVRVAEVLLGARLDRL